MHPHSPLCPNCSRPMIVIRTIPGVLGEPDVNVFECSHCRVDFTTEDHLTISGTVVP
jgi:transposase-like protein